MKTTFHLLTQTLLIITGVTLLVLCAGFFFNHPDALALWPWPDGRLSYVFVASILAAIGAPVLWMGLSGELAAMRGGALDFTVTYSGLAIMLLFFGTSVSELISIKLFLTIAALSVLFNMFLFLMVGNMPFKDERPVPWLLRASFLVFFLVLVGVGIALIMQYQAIFPWPLKPQTSVVFGWIFLGAATYFLYGFFKPVWGNVKGQLIGFLAYDLVLLMPFIQHFDTVKPAHQLSLTVYTSVLIYSASLSLYFLLIHPSTRFGSDNDQMMYIDDAI